MYSFLLTKKDFSPANLRVPELLSLACQRPVICTPTSVAMLNVLYLFFNNTRTHLKQSIDDLNSRNIQAAISELKIVDKLLRAHEQVIAKQITDLFAYHDLLSFKGVWSVIARRYRNMISLNFWYVSLSN